MNKKLFLILIFAGIGMFSASAQEYLSGFCGGVPEEEARQAKAETFATLPFFDDFTNSGIYPDASKWLYGNVLVNSGFAMMPVNRRAATFDVVDRFGKVYSNGSSNPFMADTLCSVKIRLDSIGGQALSAADSLYFSFYYQPGGYGDSPERDDSLVLQFGYGYDEEVFDSVLNGMVTLRKTGWKQMWASEGMSIDTFLRSCGENKFFKKVMIPIVDSCFFVDDFRVMFFNYGTLPTVMYPNDRSNMDMWNIDFVYLDKDRTLDDDNYPMVGFTGTAPSFLKRYQVMPYKHFKENPINELNIDGFDVYLSNMDENMHQVKYSCHVADNNSGWTYSYQADPYVINQYQNNGIMTRHVQMGDFIYPYDVPADTTSFTIRHCIEVVDEHSGEVQGDTLTRHQGFYNYFAYDDGTPEMGYGLVPDDTYFAAQFKVATLDTLSGVQMLFNRTFNDANYNFFDIVVWRDNNGKPGEIIYTLRDQRPIWNDSLIYNFSYYKFDEVVKINSVFYVGLRQQYSKSINIGFDSSNDNRQYIFYEVGDGWKNSSFPGSLMIRPVVGKRAYFVGVDENEEIADNLAVYPNPAKNVIHFEGVDENNCDAIVVYDLTGKAVRQYRYSNELNVADLSNGAYLIRAVDKNGAVKTAKLMISK
ncbi:MAG: T9SS type A sorting domain-containing protein [Bacteroidales bacterium]|nr:T9SS type A sorting domain-containing protein [Bacteroidales bacterium]